MLQHHRNGRFPGKLGAIILSAASFWPSAQLARADSPETGGIVKSAAADFNLSELKLPAADLFAGELAKSSRSRDPQPYFPFSLKQKLLFLAAVAGAMRAVQVKSCRKNLFRYKDTLKSSWNLLMRAYDQFETLPRCENLLADGQTKRAHDTVERLITKLRSTFFAMDGSFKDAQQLLASPEKSALIKLFFNPLKTIQAGKLTNYLVENMHSFNALYFRQIEPELRTLSELSEKIPALKECLADLTMQLTAICEHPGTRSSAAKRTRELRERWEREKFEPAGLDPLALYRRLVRLEEALKKAAREIQREQEKYTALKKKLPVAYDRLVQTEYLLLTLAKRRSFDPSELQLLARSHAVNKRKICQVIADLNSPEDDRWFVNFDDHVKLLNKIEADFELASDGAPSANRPLDVLTFGRRIAGL